MVFHRDPKKIQLKPEGIMVIISAMGRAISSHISGSGGGVIHHIHPLPGLVQTSNGVQEVIQEIVNRVKSSGVREGDIICCSSIVFAMAQKRNVPEEDLFMFGDPCELEIDNLTRLANNLTNMCKFSVDEGDILGVNKEKDDYYLLPNDPNGLCECIAQSILEGTGEKVDVLMADTEAGFIPGIISIGFPVIGSMPIGATAGLTLTNCMELAYLAELTWGADKGIPFIRVEPERNSCKTWLNGNRNNIGLNRGYEGRLNFIKEGWDDFFERKKI